MTSARRLITLLHKELQHHGLAFSALFVLLLGVYALTLGHLALGPTNLGWLQAHVTFVRLFLPLIGLTLASRLVVSEYYGQTQLFVEALPIRPWEPVLIKLLLGGAVIVTASLLSVASTALLASRAEPVSGAFVGIVSLRTAIAALSYWAFFFAMSFTGRFRLPLYVSIIIVLLIVSQQSSFDLMRFGPFAVAFDRLVTERVAMPWAAIAQSLGVIAGLVSVAFAVALVDEGSLAENLARPMSQREKSMVALVMLGGMTLYGVLDERRERDAYEFAQPEVVRRDDVPVSVMYLDESHRAAAEELAEALAADLAPLPDALGWQVPLPAVRIAYHGRLDRRTFETVPLEDGQGVLLRANFDQPDFDSIGLRSLVVHEVLSAVSGGRLLFEPKHWVVDGFARYWVDPEGQAGATSLIRLRALVATRDSPVSADTLRRWNQTSERLGDPLTTALAWSAFAALEESEGRDAALALARAYLGTWPPEDGRALLFEMNHGVEELMSASGMSGAALIALWNERLEHWRQGPAGAATAQVPRAMAQLEGEAGALSWQVDLGAEAAAPVAVSLMHETIGPFDGWVTPLDLAREDLSITVGQRVARGHLDGEYTSGERAVFVVELEAEALGCPLRLLTERRSFR